MTLRSDLFNSLTPENQRKVSEERLAKFRLYDTEFIGMDEEEKRHPHGTGLFFAFLVSGMIVAGIVCIHAFWAGPVQDHISEQVEE